MDMKTVLDIVATGSPLSQEQATSAFDTIMSGDATATQIGAFLMGLRVRGETVDEITAGARVMRAKAIHINAPEGAIDTCGTGGDASGTYNISTAVGIVVASLGVPVAKHGNRALSSKSGAADVLAQLGVNIEAEGAVLEKCLAEANICFMMATKHHGAMRHVGPSRVELGMRTIFNLLGPLSNPAGAKRQLIGVYDAQWVLPFAEVLRQLGSEKVWVVHGLDGLDEMTTTNKTLVAELDKGAITQFEVSPADAGLEAADASDLVGGDPAVNAAALTALLEGQTGAYRDIVLLNSAAALVVADKVSSLIDGVAMAAGAIDDGRAEETLAKLAAVSHGG
jgi:anthranilate phosphoribosyltransferase